MVVFVSRSRVLFSLLYLKNDAAPRACQIDVLNRTSTFFVVLRRMNSTIFPLQILESVVALLMVLVMDKHWLDNQFASVLPPYQMMLVNVFPAIQLSGIA